MEGDWHTPSTENQTVRLLFFFMVYPDLVSLGVSCQDNHSRRACELSRRIDLDLADRTPDRVALFWTGRTT